MVTSRAHHVVVIRSDSDGDDAAEGGQDSQDRIGGVPYDSSRAAPGQPQDSLRIATGQPELLIIAQDSPMTAP